MPPVIITPGDALSAHSQPGRPAMQTSEGLACAARASSAPTNAR